MACEHAWGYPGAEAMALKYMQCKHCLKWTSEEGLRCQRNFGTLPPLLDTMPREDVIKTRGNFNKMWRAKATFAEKAGLN